MVILFKLVINVETVILKDNSVLVFYWYKLPEKIKNNELVEDKLENFSI